MLSNKPLLDSESVHPNENLECFKRAFSAVKRLASIVLVKSP